MADSPAAPALEVIGIEKSFGAIHANRGISIAFAKGSIHGLIGENGAGKSTLMNIAYGLQRPDSGTVKIGGRVTRMTSPAIAIADGIAMVHQHFMLIDRLTVLENIVLGTEPIFGLAKAMAKARAQLSRLEQDYGLSLRPDARIRDLTMGERQSVEIVKALYRDVRILILDEPTSVLNPRQIERLFTLLRALRDDGRTVIIVSHKLKEIMDVTDKVTVLRQGKVVGDMATADTDADALAALMIGGNVHLGRIGGLSVPGAMILEAIDLTVRDRRGALKVHGFTLKIRAGEIVAIAGVAGNGQSELLQALAGMLPIDSGGIVWRGRQLESGQINPKELRNLGIAHVPEEPQRFGLVGNFAAAESAILGYHDRPPVARSAVLNRAKIKENCQAAMDDFDVRPPRPDIITSALSGGNQQKLILAREISRDPDLLLIGEPTQGVDIGAVAAIQAKLAALRENGRAVLLVTSDLEQVRALADRILVMSAGRIVGELSPEAATDTKLGLMMGGIGAKP